MLASTPKRSSFQNVRDSSDRRVARGLPSRAAAWHRPRRCRFIGSDWPKGCWLTMRKTFSILSLAALWALSSVSANAAAIIDGVGDTFTVNFNGSDDNINTSVDPWLTSSALFVVQAYSDTSLSLKVTVNNTTQSPYMSRVTGMGFDLNPEATSADVTGIFTTDSSVATSNRTASVTTSTSA